jgi:hypothetical protein
MRNGGSGCHRDVSLQSDFTKRAHQTRCAQMLRASGREERGAEPRPPKRTPLLSDYLTLQAGRWVSSASSLAGRLDHYAHQPEIAGCWETDPDMRCRCDTYPKFSSRLRCYCHAHLEREIHHDVGSSEILPREVAAAGERVLTVLSELLAEEA